MYANAPSPAGHMQLTRQIRYNSYIAQMPVEHRTRASRRSGKVSCYFSYVIPVIADLGEPKLGGMSQRYSNETW
ncbi:hypothetical protein GCM10010913_16830 [Paenibacillus aceti]|uniref:Uncharacterized protein n=1 Tax=Paenibacillus aceti TaxID=1820010 RepID=A0ABQ1VTN3_9BACL|nr:hypothetical protein GCM10010913_16830 [Paenibacillus aceti]